jgi:putative PEP-CTERM system TPR-repeat lipoprotein
MAQIQAGANKGAVSAAKKWTARAPESIQAHLALAWAHLNNQEANESAAAFRKVLELDPGNPSASHNLAVFAVNSGQVDAARELYERSQMLYQGHPNTSVALARIYQLSGEPKKAIKVLESALAKHPDNVEIGALVADYRLTEGDVKTALDSAEKLYLANQEDVRVLAVLGSARAASGNFNQAINAFEQLQRRSTLNPHNHYKLAMARFRSGDSAGFSREIQDAYAAYPDSYPIMVAAADLFIAEKNLKEAKRLSKKMTQRYPDRLAVHEQALRVAQLTGDSAAALEGAKNARRLAPDNSSYMVRYALALWGQEEYDIVFEELENWMAAKPDDQLVDYNLANFYMLAGRERDAISAFTRVIERNGNHAVALNNLAWILRKEDPKRSLQLAERAHSLAPRTAAIQDTLAMLLLDAGEGERAVSILNGAAAFSPHRTDIQYHLALAYSKTGDNLKALRVLSTLMRANDNFPEKADAEALQAALSEQAGTDNE